MNCEENNEINEILESVRNIPYPEVCCVNPNSRFICMLYDAYAGMNGELTAVTQYTYQSLMFNNEKIAEIMHHISIVEMRHLAILGNLLKKSGRAPIYKSGDGMLWTAKNVNYVMKNVKEVMVDNIRGEEIAIQNYRRLIECTNDENVRCLIERIILDEKAHIDVFKKIIEKYC